MSWKTWTFLNCPFSSPEKLLEINCPGNTLLSKLTDLYRFCDMVSVIYLYLTYNAVMLLMYDTLVFRWHTILLCKKHTTKECYCPGISSKNTTYSNCFDMTHMIWQLDVLCCFYLKYCTMMLCYSTCYIRPFWLTHCYSLTDNLNLGSRTETGTYFFF